MSRMMSFKCFNHCKIVFNYSRLSFDAADVEIICKIAVCWSSSECEDTFSETPIVA